MLKHSGTMGTEENVGEMTIDSEFGFFFLLCEKSILCMSFFWGLGVFLVGVDGVEVVRVLNT